MQRGTFDEFKARVDRHLLRRVGMTSDELPDTDLALCYAQGDSPRDTAQFVLEEVGFIDPASI